MVDIHKLYWISQILDIPALTLMKLSCMLFYSRIFSIGSDRIVGVLIHVTNSLILIWGLGFWLSFLFPCKTHWEWMWTSLVNMAKCPSDLLMMHKALVISNAIMDVMIFIFPVPLVSHPNRRGWRWLVLIVADCSASYLDGEKDIGTGYILLGCNDNCYVYHPARLYLRASPK